MSGKKGMMEVANKVGLQAAHLEQSVDALDVLDDIMGREGHQFENKEDAPYAACFLQRLPAFLSALRVVNRDVRRVVEELSQLQAQIEAEAMKTAD